MVKRFYIYKEGSCTTDSQLKAVFLAPANFKFIETKEYTFWSFMREMTKGSRCMALKKDGSIVSFVWINDRYIEYYNIKKPLKKNEAFFYYQITKPEERGKGYAEILRAKCYEKLRAQGKDTFYSITDEDNEPALRFKEKIGAEIIASYTFFKFWKFKYLYERKNKRDS